MNHTDQFHVPIKVGDIVAMRTNKLIIGTVTKLTPKGVTISPILNGGCINRPMKDVLNVTQQYQYAQNTFPEEFI